MLSWQAMTLNGFLRFTMKRHGRESIDLAPNTRFSRLAQLIATCRGVDGLVGFAPDTGGVAAPRPLARCLGRCCGCIQIESKPVQNADTHEPTFDREFAVAAAKPYVEAYQRQHPPLKDWSFAWNQARVVFVSVPDGSTAKGYLGVFFPRNESSGVGFTCFKVAEDADHLDPLIWGYAPDFLDAIENFRRYAATSSCSHIQ